MPRVYIALGSNLGNRGNNLNDALSALESHGIKILKKSSVAETDPVDFLNQPKFFNQIVFVETELEPLELISVLKKIEASLGRTKVIPKGPRIIDLDLLLYDDIVLDTADLKIPHPRMKKRKFILDHLAELNEDLIDPETGKKFTELIYDDKKHK